MNWLTADWRLLMPVPWGHVALSVVSIICGAIIGTEREKREKPAGLRTLILVCLGSTAFTLVSYAFGTTTGDTGRVAAQIVTGIGFLGAGVILHGRTAVSGITTAATIWAAAAIGMVVGIGYAPGGLLLSLGVRGVLSGLFWWEHLYIGQASRTVVELVFDPGRGKTRFHLESLLEQYQIQNGLGEITEQPGGTARVRIVFKLPRHQRAEFLQELASLPQVLEMHAET